MKSILFTICFVLQLFAFTQLVSANQPLKPVLLEHFEGAEQYLDTAWAFLGDKDNVGRWLAETESRGDLPFFARDGYRFFLRITGTYGIGPALLQQVFHFSDNENPITLRRPESMVQQLINQLLVQYPLGTVTTMEGAAISGADEYREKTLSEHTANFRRTFPDKIFIPSNLVTERQLRFLGYDGTIGSKGYFLSVTRSGTPTIEILRDQWTTPLRYLMDVPMAADRSMRRVLQPALVTKFREHGAGEVEISSESSRIWSMEETGAVLLVQNSSKNKLAEVRLTSADSVRQGIGFLSGIQQKQAPWVLPWLEQRGGRRAKLQEAVAKVISDPRAGSVEISDASGAKVIIAPVVRTHVGTQKSTRGETRRFTTLYVLNEAHRGPLAVEHFAEVGREKFGDQLRVVTTRKISR